MTIKCRIGIDGRRYYFKNGSRISEAAAKRSRRSKSVKCSKARTRCVLGLNGAKYYYRDGVRIPAGHVRNARQIKCRASKQRKLRGKPSVEVVEDIPAVVDIVTPPPAALVPLEPFMEDKEIEFMKPVEIDIDKYPIALENAYELMDPVFYDLDDRYPGEFNQRKILSLILQEYGSLIPLEQEITRKEVSEGRDKMFKNVIYHKHVRLLKEIYNLFGINAIKYLHGYKISSRINVESVYGILYYIFSPEMFKNIRFSNRSVLKVQRNKSGEVAMEYEAHVQREFMKHDLAPTLLYEHHIKMNPNDVVSILLMDKYKNDTLSTRFTKESIKTFVKYIYEDIIQIIETLIQYKLTHGDLHWDNVGIEYDKNMSRDFKYKISLLDFGQSTYGISNPKLEILQLLRTIGMFDFYDESARQALETMLYNYYIQKYNDGLEKSFNGPNGYEVRHCIEWNNYMNTYFEPNLTMFMKQFHNYE